MAGPLAAANLYKPAKFESPSSSRGDDAMVAQRSPWESLDTPRAQSPTALSLADSNGAFRSCFGETFASRRV